MSAGPLHNITRLGGRNLALAITVDDFAVNDARPLSPHIKVVGPLTAKPAKPLPAELEGYMRSAGDAGVVFASFGTTAIPGKLRCQDLKGRMHPCVTDSVSQGSEGICQQVSAELHAN